MKKFSIVLAILLGVMVAPKVHAAEFTIDPEYSNVIFKIKHLMGIEAGHFKKVSGTIKLNADNKDLAGFSGTLDMTSIDTNNPQRDKDLKSEHFFDVEKFPQADVTSTKVEKGTIYVNFTLHGVTKTIPLQYLFRGLAQDQFGRTKTAVSLMGRLNRKDFGITYNIKTDDGKWLLGDEIEFIVELQGILPGTGRPVKR